MKTNFTLSDAIHESEKGNLREWVVRYLREEGNNLALAGRIEESQLVFLGLEDVLLSKLERIIGPEEGRLFKEEREVFEERIKKLMDAVEKGEIFPPLVITDFWKLGTIQDGAHRWEALVRSGVQKYPAIICFEKQESLDFLK